MAYTVVEKQVTTTGLSKIQNSEDKKKCLWKKEGTRNVEMVAKARWSKQEQFSYALSSL